jgi:hypothetical protein
VNRSGVTVLEVIGDVVERETDVPAAVAADPAQRLLEVPPN